MEDNIDLQDEQSIKVLHGINNILSLETFWSVVKEINPKHLTCISLKYTTTPHQKSSNYFWNFMKLF